MKVHDSQPAGNRRSAALRIIDLKGRKAVVTGSTAGIGLAIAEGLARAGAAVVINGRTEERVTIALLELRAHFPTADIAGIAADLATEKGSAAFTEQAKDADILVNNLGTAKPKPFYELTDSDWRELFEINVMSGVRMTRHYLPGMTKRGWGRVVFISSESALAIPKEMIDYGMTKTAQLAIARGVAESVAGSGVTVNAVLPGPTRSENPDQHDEGEGRSRRHNARAGRAEFLDDDAANHASATLRDHRRGRKHGHLCLFGAGIRDDRRRVAR
jgi:NAD(P)-dependent dehydrogenase (short-subunit alcohol dehydrogenase family)